jgi:threonylcarbamoyladenosine tRNA methylthiotransferase MtaB
MKIAFHTMGCKVNQFDTAVLEEQARGADHTLVRFDEAADVYVINSCSVTENSDREARRLVRQLKRRNPGSRIVMTGCYAQTHPEELAQIQGIDLVIGNDRKRDLVDHLGGCEKEPGEALGFEGGLSRGPLDQPLIREFRGHTRFFLKVQDGCDFDCSFCLIPRARGQGRSLPMEQVVNQVKVLTEGGCREVVLTGVNLGAYGRDFEPKQTLSGLLRHLLEQTGISRIRLSSLEPKTITSELLKIVESSSRICRHFHVPLQSGADATLKKMNRHYSRIYYRRLILSLFERFPEAGIGTDVMVGFPGETEDAFRMTHDLLNELPMSYFHVFPFSPRPQTPAAGMDSPVSESEKKRRADALRRLSAEKGRRFAERHVGSELPVLIEKERDERTGHLKGLSDNYIKVLLPGPDQLMNRIERVRITGIDGERVVGRLEDDMLPDTSRNTVLPIISERNI